MSKLTSINHVALQLDPGGARQLTLDILATWLAHWRIRSDRIQRHLEVAGVSNETLDAATNEGQAIIRYLAAVGRVR